LRELKKEARSFQAQKKKLQQEAVSLTETLQKEKERKEKLEEEKIQLEEKTGELYKLYKQEKELRKKAEENVASEREAKAKLEEEIKFLEEKCQNLGIRICLFHSHFFRLEFKVQATAKVKSRLGKAKETHKEEVLKLTQLNETLKEENESLKSEYEERLTEQSAVKTALEKLLDELQSQLTEIKAMKEEQQEEKVENQVPEPRQPNIGEIEDSGPHTLQIELMEEREENDILREEKRILELKLEAFTNEKEQKQDQEESVTNRELFSLRKRYFSLSNYINLFLLAWQMNQKKLRQKKKNYLRK